MNAENIKQLLRRLNRGEKLDRDTLRRLTEDGYIRSTDVSNMQTPEGVRELLFISFTDKGQELLEGSQMLDRR